MKKETDCFATKKNETESDLENHYVMFHNVNYFFKMILDLHS